MVYVNYSLSPEAKYPVALEEAYTATKWVAENGQEINLSSSILAVAGDSAGGNTVTAAVAMLVKEREDGPNISFQALFYPVTDYYFNTATYEQFQNGYHLTCDAMKWFWNNYVDNQTTDIKDPLVSTLQHPSNSYRVYHLL